MNPRKRYSPFDLPKSSSWEALIEIQKERVTLATTPEAKVTAENMLAGLKTMTGWTKAKELAPYFILYYHVSGEWSAELSSTLHQSMLSLKSSAHGDVALQKTIEGVTAIFAMTSFPDDGSLQSTNASRVLFSTLHKTLIPRLAVFKDVGSPDIPKEAKALKKDLIKAIDSLALIGKQPLHKSATTAEFQDESGVQKKQRLELRAIEGARILAETTQELPTKKAVQNWLLKQHPHETEFLSQAKWSKLWRTAGLQMLPDAKPWAE